MAVVGQTCSIAVSILLFGNRPAQCSSAYPLGEAISQPESPPHAC